ncbi:TRIM3 [Branchiostoma lanceolatum]|uniref:TRIM3 protein n=1 Tax=Branchiostoma lanceolatum TaxID=7740 RepID=A0A8J9YZ28_BRALA|nr:TRIM3 [Branchiostoma lanceolatum]
MLQADNKIGKGDLGLLLQILKSLGKGRLAEEAEQLEQQQRTEAQAAAAVVPQTAPMSEAHRTVLLRNYPTIYQELDATGVLDYLYQGGVLTEGMREEILAIPYHQRHHRTRKLLDMILHSSDRTFTIFRSALGHAGYRHLMELLTGGQQQLMPPNPMALAIYLGFQGSEGFDMSIEEQPQLTIPTQHLLITKSQGKQILKLKRKMRKEELKTLYKYEKKKVKSLKRAKAFLSQESLDRKFDELWAKVDEQKAIIVSTYRGCVILFLTFESEPKFEHFWGSCTSGDLSATLSELLLTEEMRGTEGGDQLVVRTLVLEQDVTAWRDYFKKDDDAKASVEAVLSQITERVENLDVELTDMAQNCEEVEKEIQQHYKKIRSKIDQEEQEMVTKFPINVEGPAVESLPCSVTVITNKADLTGGNVAPQIEVTSPQGKTTLIQTTAHTSPPLAAGKGQTSRVRRVWGAEWRPQESGKHTLGVCMGGKKDLGSFTVNVGSNNPVLRFGQEGSQQGQFDNPMDVAVRGDRLYVPDMGNQRVQVFDLSGNFCHSFSTTTNPVSVAVQTDGTIVVRSGKEVKKFSPSGELLHTFPLGEYCTDPWGLAVQRDGRVVVADIGKDSIFLFEADGTLVKQVGGKGQGEGQFDQPGFVCVDKEDNIIVADKGNNRVQVFDKNLNFKHKFGQQGRQPQDMWWPTGVSVDSRGNIVLANLGVEKLQVFRLDGTWLATISSDRDKLGWPRGVAVTEDGHVFVADIGDNCIRKYRYM